MPVQCIKINEPCAQFSLIYDRDPPLGSRPIGTFVIQQKDGQCKQFELPCANFDQAREKKLFENLGALDTQSLERFIKKVNQEARHFVSLAPLAIKSARESQDLEVFSKVVKKLIGGGLWRKERIDDHFRGKKELEKRFDKVPEEFEADVRRLRDYQLGSIKEKTVYHTGKERLGDCFNSIQAALSNRNHPFHEEIASMLQEVLKRGKPKEKENELLSVVRYMYNRGDFTEALLLSIGRKV